MCWLPFFTLYLVRPFVCEDCINQILFSVLFWLGYCNSAINPMIYAMFSRDFRFAFKRVIYRCFCSKKYLEENKFHVLHRFVPFPLAAAVAGAGQRNDFNFDLGRWPSFNSSSPKSHHSSSMRPITEMCHPIVISNISTVSNTSSISHSTSTTIATAEPSTSKSLFRGNNRANLNSIPVTKL